MGIELACLLGAVILLAILLFVQGSLVPLEQGFRYGLGPRDEARPASRISDRFKRTIANHMEGLALYAPLALTAKILAISTPLTQLGAMLYLAGRVAFAVCYTLGVPVLRSVSWGISIIGILLVGYEVLQAGV